MRIGALAATAAAVILSLALNLGLFSFLPAMTYWRHRGEGVAEKARETSLVPLAMMPKKKEKPKTRESKQPQARKAPEPGKAVSRQRFVMDLGVGGGSGAAVGGDGVSKGDLQQVSYEEGETDEDARAISQSAPKKPKKAESAGVGGLVRCILTVGEDGRVVDVQFLEVPAGYGFEEAVKEAVSSWRYKPAMVGGIPVRQRIEQPFKF